MPCQNNILLIITTKQVTVHVTSVQTFLLESQSNNNQRKSKKKTVHVTQNNNWDTENDHKMLQNEHKRYRMTIKRCKDKKNS